MEELEQVENKKAFRNIIYVIIGIILLAAATTAFILLRKESKTSFDANELNSNLATQETGEKALFSEDIGTWKNYYWSGKINTHYPSDWSLKEKIAENGTIDSLEIIPPTDSALDTIFIGGNSVKCSSIVKYAKSKCLTNTIQVPFYTNSTNQEVLSAFDLILDNTILVDIEK